MTRHHQPRKGSVAFSPRKRAAKESPRINAWPETEETCLLGFPGYKVGMTHVTMLDTIKGSPTEGLEVSTPVTILEAPAVVAMGIRAYRKDTRGLKTMTDIIAAGLEGDIERTITPPKEDKVQAKIAELREKLDEVEDIRVLIHTKPKLASIPKKRPEILEFGIGGKTVAEKLDYAESVLGKEITPQDTFNDGEHADAVAVTKGKGFQGPVKRFGVRIQYGKAARSSKKRHVGSIGPWTPARTMWTVAMAGQMGYHKRTEFNKKILKVGDVSEADAVNPEGGFVKYGLVKNGYFMVKGSVPGPSKRLIVLRKAIRPHGKHDDVPQISYISTASKQGV
ncbi:50S ribosomal protein L3 [Methanobacterium aggregans]|uniref:50S ribosomal protein L3 n=1 Tax=Methanobacterium aggregans TaxID=1615586 RepID=UPI001AEB9311|nr:50S ribosomal protein L3 [Methanobacterium aggregans]MBP2044894.1 large subunit ribosomal protein L3 [Methanobacterium aggregans]